MIFALAMVLTAQTPECTGVGGKAEPACDLYTFESDFDDDTFADEFDNCPIIANPTQDDGDIDGFGDACDNCVFIPNASQTDTDADFIGDECDVDADNDFLENDLDNCPLVFNLGQENADGDAFGDDCDDNDDGDACPDVDDSCPALANADCADPDPNAPDECFHERDGDGIDDHVDNCPGLTNAEQGDVDGDGVGDVCDQDRDGDGITNSLDNCFGVVNLDQADGDRDFVGDACDDETCFEIVDEETCLLLGGAFAVHAGDTIVADVGDRVMLRLFTNAIDPGDDVEYTWSVVEAPDASAGAAEIIANASGTSTFSLGPERVYNVGERAEFVPDVDGAYRLRVDATLVVDGSTAFAEVDALVGDVGEGEGEPGEGEGEPGEGEGEGEGEGDGGAPTGCGCSGVRAANLADFAALAFLLCVSRPQRFKRRE